MNLFRKCLLSIVLSTTSVLISFPQIISISNQSLKFKEIILGYHFGDGIYKLKSIHLNENGFGLFHQEELKSGTYYIFYNDSILSEFLYDANFPGKIGLNFDHTKLHFSLEGPQPVVNYHKFNIDLNKVSRIAKNTQPGNEKDKRGKKKADLVQASPINTLFNHHKDSLIIAYIEKSESDFLNAYLKSQMQVAVPEYTPSPDIQNPDSVIWNYQIEYYKKHYLDNLDLADIRLVSTPIYTEKLNLFLDQITSQQPEKICRSVDYVIDKTKNDTSAQKFLVSYLLKKYENQKHDPVSEFVFLHIIEKHYLQSGYNWITNKDTDLLNKEFNRLKPASLGQKAPEISLKDTLGNIIDLNSLNGDLIVLYFLSYDCPVCEKVTREIKKTAWKFDYLDFKIVTVCLGNDEIKWKKYLKAHGMVKWTNLIGGKDMGNIALNYNLMLTPTLLLLDSNKIIIDKNMTSAQLNRAFLNLAIDSHK